MKYRLLKREWKPDENGDLIPDLNGFVPVKEFESKDAAKYHAGMMADEFTEVIIEEVERE